MFSYLTMEERVGSAPPELTPKPLIQNGRGVLDPRQIVTRWIDSARSDIISFRSR
jgi:hypothetical protein